MEASETSSEALPRREKTKKVKELAFAENLNWEKSRWKLEDRIKLRDESRVWIGLLGLLRIQQMKKKVRAL